MRSTRTEQCICEIYNSGWHRCKPPPKAASGDGPLSDQTTHRAGWNAVKSLLPVLSGFHEPLGELLKLLNKDLEDLTEAEENVKGNMDSKLRKKLRESSESVRRYETLIKKVKLNLQDFESRENNIRQVLEQEIIDLLRECKLEYENMNKCLDDAVSCAVELRKECKKLSKSCETKRSEAIAKLWSLVSNFFVCVILDAGLYKWANSDPTSTSAVAVAATDFTAVKDSACAVVTTATAIAATVGLCTTVTTLPVGWNICCRLRQLSKLQTSLDSLKFHEEIEKLNKDQEEHRGSLFDAEQKFKTMLLDASGQQAFRQDPTRSDRGALQLNIVPELPAIVREQEASDDESDSHGSPK